ncbi:Qdr3 protein [Martiniozyma asiatica (nom. inval.)]|nr:Qdr3 protein [Martiniozyma asiatica]
MNLDSTSNLDLESLNSVDSMQAAPEPVLPHTSARARASANANASANAKGRRRPSTTGSTQLVVGSSFQNKFSTFKNESDNSSTISPRSSPAGIHTDMANNNNNEQINDLQKTETLLTKMTSLKFPTSKLVPKDKRRGILPNICLIPEYKDARELPNRLRFLIVFIIGFCAMIGPMGTSILLPASNNAIEELNTTITILNVAIGVYLITLGILPLWWSNFSERHGRRSIYIISFTLYLCFTIGCALSTNINMLIGFRVLSGGCAASVQSVGAGTIGDLYPITKRGSAMGLFYLGPLCGPLLAPIIGGAITSNPNAGWRATQWFLVGLSGLSCFLIILFLPETLRKQDNKEAIRKILRDRLKKKDSPDSTISNDDIEKQNDSIGSLNEDEDQYDYEDEDEDEEINNMTEMLTRMSTNQSYNEETEEPIMDSVVPLSKIPTANSNKYLEHRKNIQFQNKRLENEVKNIDKIQKSNFLTKLKFYLKIYLFGPLKAFVFLKYPPVLLAVLYSGPCFAALYVNNMTLTYCYSRDPYNFNSVLVGLVYIPNSVTYFIASVWGGKFNDYLLKKKIEKYGVVAPEARFGINVYIAAGLLPCSMLITGWCLEYKEHWVTPLIGTALFGFAQMIVIGVTITYLADCLPGRGATGIALNNFIRMLMAAGVSFATEPLIRALGTGVLFSICAGVCAVLSGLIVIIIKMGDRWRETYNLEKLYDIYEG